MEYTGGYKIWHTASFEKGSSGSPLFIKSTNDDVELIGVLLGEDPINPGLKPMDQGAVENPWAATISAMKSAEHEKYEKLDDDFYPGRATAVPFICKEIQDCFSLYIEKNIKPSATSTLFLHQLKSAPEMHVSTRPEGFYDLWLGDVEKLAISSRIPVHKSKTEGIEEYIMQCENIWFSAAEPPFKKHHSLWNLLEFAK